MSSGLTPARRKARLLRAFVSGRPVWCSWQLTRRCGALCLFCEHRVEAADEELDLAGIRRVSTELGTLGSLAVSLSGGEPFLRADLPAVVACIAETHFPLLTTHGWLVDETKARAVWQAGLQAASVRMDHADPEPHDADMGLPGAHRRAVAALAALAATRTRPGQQVNVKTCLRGVPDDAARVAAVARLAETHGASLSLEPAFPVGKGTATALSAPLIDLRRRHRNLRSSAYFLGRLDAAWGEGVPGCRAARSFLNVDHRGRVSKCIEFQGPSDSVGDLSRERASELAPRLQAVASQNACRACWSASRGEVEALYSLRGVLGTLPALMRS